MPLFTLIFFIPFQLSKIQAEHHQLVKHALSIPSRKVQEGLLATQKEFLEHTDPSNVDNLAKFILLNEKELGIKVTEIGENVEKLIHCDIFSHLGSEAVLPEDVAKTGILGVILNLFHHLFC